MELKNLRKEYEGLAKKHKLPGFKEVNENFEIDKIDKNTDCTLRLVRKVMMEKIVNSLSFLELLLNPVNAPRIYMAYIRTMSADDRKIIDELYSALGKLSLLSLDLEIDYSEKKEAEIISNIFKTWDSLKPKFRKILANIKSPNGNFVRKEKSYLG